MMSANDLELSAELTERIETYIAMYASFEAFEAYAEGYPPSEASMERFFARLVLDEGEDEDSDEEARWPNVLEIYKDTVKRLELQVEDLENRLEDAQTIIDDLTEERDAAHKLAGKVTDMWNERIPLYVRGIASGTESAGEVAA
jgi:predicted RNase H-like nuclease (RuvC/YqgF family)